MWCHAAHHLYSILYGSLFYVIIYKSYKLLKNGPVFSLPCAVAMNCSACTYLLFANYMSAKPVSIRRRGQRFGIGVGHLRTETQVMPDIDE